MILLNFHSEYSEQQQLFDINVKKLQFIHVLTTTCIDWHSKNYKKVILATITSTQCQCAAD